MRKTISIPLLAALLLGVAGTPSFAFNQPPLNLGLTDILDGALPPHHPLQRASTGGGHRPDPRDPRLRLLGPRRRPSDRNS